MIEKTVESIVAELMSVYDSEHSGMRSDMRNCFDTEKTLIFEEIRFTNYPQCMFEIDLGVRDTTTHLTEVADTLYDCWRDIQYNYFQATSLQYCTNLALFRFVTVSDSDSDAYFATGKVIVSGERYRELSAQLALDEY